MLVVDGVHWRLISAQMKRNKACLNGSDNLRMHYADIMGEHMIFYRSLLKDIKDFMSLRVCCKGMRYDLQDGQTCMANHLFRTPIHIDGCRGNSKTT